MNTELIRATGGEIIIKSGAEGVCCAIDLRRGLGMAFKAQDGAGRAVEAAALAVLQKLQCLKSDEVNAISKRINPKIQNWSGTEVGQIRVDINF